MKMGNISMRGILAATVLAALTGSAAAQTSGQQMRERAAAEPQSAPGAAKSDKERVPGNAPYNNQTEKLSNPLGANGK